MVGIVWCSTTPDASAVRSTVARPLSALQTSGARRPLRGQFSVWVCVRASASVRALRSVLAVCCYDDGRSGKYFGHLSSFSVRAPFCPDSRFSRTQIYSRIFCVSGPRPFLIVCRVSSLFSRGSKSHARSSAPPTDWTKGGRGGVLSVGMCARSAPGGTPRQPHPTAKAETPTSATRRRWSFFTVVPTSRNVFRGFLESTRTPRRAPERYAVQDGRPVRMAPFEF